MRHLDTMEPGGYPFDDISIKYLQEMHDDRDAFLYAIFGDSKIVRGVQLNAQSNLYSDGLISIGGKLYHFVGGAPQAKISKKTIATKRQYEDGIQKKAFVNEFYEFGTAGTDAINFSTLKRWYHNQPILKEIKYVGASVANANLPDGWFIADGTNGTDDLRSKFIVGLDSRDTDYSSIGKSGGEKKHQLSESEMPSHKHAGTITPAGTHQHGIEDGAGGDDGAGRVVAGSDYGIQDLSLAKTKNAGEHIHGVTLNDTGGDQSHENRPPFYTLLIIQFVGI